MRFVVGEMKVVERNCVAAELQGRVEVLNWLAMDHRVRKLDPAGSSRVRLGALNLQGEVCCPTDGKVESTERKNFFDVRVAHVDANRDWAGIDELSLLQAGSEL